MSYRFLTGSAGGAREGQNMVRQYGPNVPYFDKYRKGNLNFIRPLCFKFVYVVRNGNFDALLYANVCENIRR